MARKEIMTSAFMSRLMQDGIEMHQRGDIADAASCYSQVLKFEPKNVNALCLLGRAFRELNRLTESVELLRKAIKVAPKHAAAHNYLGQTLRDQGRVEEALASFRRAIFHQPDLMEAHVKRADLLMALNRAGEAVEAYDHALRVRPYFFEGYCNRGVALEATGRLEDAIKSYDQAIALRPNVPAVHANRGNALAALGQHGAAIESFDRALADKPNFAEVYLNRGNSLARLGRHDEALTSYEKASEIRPEMAEAYFGRGTVYRDQSRFEEAVGSYDRAIELNRNGAVRGLFHLHRAETLNEIGRFQEALADVRRSLEGSPENDEVLYGVSMIELLHGHWLEAWPRYERRTALKVGIPPGFVPPRWPQWHGEVLRDELLVLRGEQGLGDQIQFSMFGSHLAKLGYRVALWVDPILESLLKTTSGVERVIVDMAALEELGQVRWTWMMSVPGLLALTPNTIPQVTPYLSVRPDRAAAWRERLSTDRLKVGIVWAGHQQNIRGLKRSAVIERLAPLFTVPGIHWFSLQVFERAGDIVRLPPGTVTDLSSLVIDFAEMACAINALDLVITVDTAVPHIAGALAKPVWVMLPFLPDWRWLLDSNSTGWYPTARLFRQPSRGDWDSVVERVRGELGRLARSG
jgi:tetratricopeptide (TPR) repeat protein